MKIIKSKIPGVLVVHKKRFYDERGFFSESWSKREFREHGIDEEFVQDNHSFSAKAGTLRGLHFQYPPAAQAKLIRCGRGEFLNEFALCGLQAHGVDISDYCLNFLAVSFL